MILSSSVTIRPILHTHTTHVYEYFLDNTLRVSRERSNLHSQDELDFSYLCIDWLPNISAICSHVWEHVQFHGYAISDHLVGEIGRDK